MASEEPNEPVSENIMHAEQQKNTLIRAFNISFSFSLLPNRETGQARDFGPHPAQHWPHRLRRLRGLQRQQQQYDGPLGRDPRVDGQRPHDHGQPAGLRGPEGQAEAQEGSRIANFGLVSAAISLN